MERKRSLPPERWNGRILSNVKEGWDQIFFFKKSKPPFCSTDVALKVALIMHYKSSDTYHSPQDTFQFHDDLHILFFMSMLYYKLRKIREMSFLLKDLAA